MERRKFLAGTALAGVTTNALCAPALAQDKREWVVTSAFGKASMLGQALEDFARFVAEQSEGRLTFQLYHANELVPALESLDAVQSGTAQMGYGAPFYWAGKSDSISFVAAIPFGLTAQEQNAWAYYGGGIEIADKAAYHPLGLKFLPMGNTGNQMGGWYAKEINRVEDLKGLKFRMPGLGGEILSTFGTQVVLLAGSDVLPALSSGAIDGTEWIGPAADLGFGLYKVCKNYYYPGWHEPAAILDGFFDLNEWESLPDDLKALVEHAAAATNMQILSKFQALNNAALQKLVKEHGVQLRPYSAELVSAIGQRAGDVIPQLAEKSADSAMLYNHIINFHRTMVEWSTYSEANFLNARVATNFKTV